MKFSRGKFKKISRQRRWQLRKIGDGLCYICGKFKVFRNLACVACWKKNRAYKLAYRKAHGQKKEWKGKEKI